MVLKYRIICQIGMEISRDGASLALVTRVARGEELAG
jgi:hypothetical protein